MMQKLFNEFESQDDFLVIDMKYMNLTYCISF